MNTIKSILVIFLLFVGVAFAAPINLEKEVETKSEADTRLEYASSLNAMATTIMSWYGSLISVSETENEVAFIKQETQWADYRAHYPQNITQIEFISTNLKKTTTPAEYQFVVNTQMQYEDATGSHSQTRHETFVFHAPTLVKPIIKEVINASVEKVENTNSSQYNRSYYKAREFAYGWLAYLDDVTGQELLEKQLENVQYQFKIGSNTVQGSAAEALTQRKQYLAQGGHLLRALDVIKHKDKPGYFVLDLIIEWKGVNESGKPVLAKIHQEIEYQVLEGGEWQINTIKEEHLLPDIAPWSGLLC